MPISWITRIDEPVPDRGGFTIRAFSGEVSLSWHLDRHALREFVEATAAMLDATDRREQHGVSEINDGTDYAAERHHPSAIPMEGEREDH